MSDDETIARLRHELNAERRKLALLRNLPPRLLKPAERHCEWPAFKHALAAVMNELDAECAPPPHPAPAHEGETHGETE